MALCLLVAGTMISIASTPAAANHTCDTADAPPLLLGITALDGGGVRWFSEHVGATVVYNLVVLGAGDFMSLDVWTECEAGQPGGEHCQSMATLGVPASCTTSGGFHFIRLACPIAFDGRCDFALAIART